MRKVHFSIKFLEIHGKSHFSTPRSGPYVEGNGKSAKVAKVRENFRNFTEFHDFADLQKPVPQIPRATDVKSRFAISDDFS